MLLKASDATNVGFPMRAFHACLSSSCFRGPHPSEFMSCKDSSADQESISLPGRFVHCRVEEFREAHIYIPSFILSDNSLVHMFSFYYLSLYRRNHGPPGQFLRQRLPELFWYQSFEVAKGMLSEVDM